MSGSDREATNGWARVYIPKTQNYQTVEIFRLEKFDETEYNQKNAELRKKKCMFLNWEKKKSIAKCSCWVVSINLFILISWNTKKYDCS